MAVDPELCPGVARPRHRAPQLPRCHPSARRAHGLRVPGPSAPLPADRVPGQGRAHPGSARPAVRAPCHLAMSPRPGISNAEARQPGKAPNFSVNWTVGDSAIEVINATTGKDELGRASRLCKHALYCRWMRVHGKVLRPPPAPARPASALAAPPTPGPSGAPAGREPGPGPSVYHSSAPEAALSAPPHGPPTPPGASVAPCGGARQRGGAGLSDTRQEGPRAAAGPLLPQTTPW